MVDVAHAPEPAEEPVPSSASTAVRMSDEEAATKIQSRFRGHQARKSGPAVKRSATLAARPSPPKPVPVPPVAGAPLPETVDMRASQAHLLQAMAAAGTPNEDAQKQLVNLALAMQAQITQLTDAVRTLQTQAAAPVPTPSPVAPVTAAPVMVAGAGRTGAPYDAAAALAASSAAAEVEALASAAAAAAAGSAVKFAGAAEPPSSTGASGPSRAVRAALHESGQHGGLPADVRAMLKRKPIVKPSAHTDVSLEARDLRVQSEVIVQLAAYKSHDAFNVPTSLKTLYFTFQFFDFPPTTTERLSLGDANSAEFGEAMRLLIRQAATGGDASVPGLLLKYLVGGGSKGAVVDDRAESEEAQARRMAFCHYLKNRALSIDVFDGESLLQIGTLTVDLQVGLPRLPSPPTASASAASPLEAFPEAVTYFAFIWPHMYPLFALPGRSIARLPAPLTLFLL
jgi:nephrocystin-4